MTCFKRFFSVFLFLSAVLMGAGCSVNPATGDKQFAPFMSPQQEVGVGASEHQKVVAEYGLVQDPILTSYVSGVGQKVTQDTERSDVLYKFFVLDSSVVNAFALPGGYVYVTRGLLALCNNEAELAAVLAHETGHITARHSAERYSTGVVTSLGVNILSAAIGGGAGLSQALGLGSDMALKSYSRGQESEADTLGLRYMTRAGYDPSAMAAFLSSLQADSALESRKSGRERGALSGYFSTHPATAERVAQARVQEAQYPKGGILERAEYLKTIDGMVFGESPNQGFVREGTFYHPLMGFAFNVPQGFKVENQPAQVVLRDAKTGALVIFDVADLRGGGAVDPLSYLQGWMKDAPLKGVARVDVNGMNAATGTFEGEVEGKVMNIRLMTIAWGGRIVRFQIAMPFGASSAILTDLKRMTYSFRAMTGAEKRAVQPPRLQVFTAQAGDSVESVARAMPALDLGPDFGPEFQEARLRVLNALPAGEDFHVGEMYKTVVE